jgi:hypothetical protein
MDEQEEVMNSWDDGYPEDDDEDDEDNEEEPIGGKHQHKNTRKKRGPKKGTK